MVLTRKGTKEDGQGLGNCAVCQDPDDGLMVQCDMCDEWSHFECVGVSDDVAERAWSCKKCTAASTANATRQTIATTMVNERNQPVGIQVLEESTKVGEPEEVASKRGSAKSKRNMKLDLMRLEEQKKAELLYVEKKYEIMRNYETSDESETEDDFRSLKVNRTTQWVNGKDRGELDKARDCRQVGALGIDRGGIIKADSAPQAETWAVPTISTGLSAQQISSRQVVPKDLPTFSGKAEEWPLFISSFENSTRLCGFSHDENLLRLQSALKGKALEYIGNKLMIPALVPEIISTLRMVFGRPEHIINSLLLKLRAAPAVNPNRLETLITFALEVKNLTATMEASGLQGHLTNPLMIQELIGRLPAAIRLQWAMFSRPALGATLKEFSEWLFDLADAASRVATISTAAHETERQRMQRVGFHQEGAEVTNDDERQTGGSRPLTCYLCDGPHMLLKCEKFKGMSYDEKWEAVRDLRLCRSCLKKHDPRNCRERRDCGVNGCVFKHHPLMHKPEQEHDGIRPTTIAIHHQETSGVLYRILPITIYGNGASCDVYAFLDDGSGPTLIEKRVLQQLELKGTEKELCLRWTDGTIRVERKSEVLDLEVSPHGKNKKLSLRDVRSVEALDLPEQTLNMDELAAKYTHLRGLPVDSYRNVRPQMIIGLSNRSVAMPLKFREGNADEPAATKTRIGWTVYGVVNRSSDPKGDNVHLHICECDDDIALQKLMVESMTIEKMEDENDRQVRIDNERQMKVLDCINRVGESFIVRLLWKSKNITMPDNYSMALQRLRCFERKLSRDPELSVCINDHISAMETRGYIRKLNPIEAATNYPRKWYLPIFAVRNPNKPKKVRVVWDAAAQFEGVSLNACLEKGPDLLTPLVAVLFNFRIGKIGICGDISEMFHRVLMNEEDQQSQRFLWRECDATRKPETYKLQVMSFGASCSPTLAQLVKNQNAREFIDTHPRAVKSIIERHYVDDMLDSVNSVQEAIELAKDVRRIHKNANFHIRNWLSNSVEVVEALGDTTTTSNFCSAGKRVEQAVEADKVLGMWWNTSSDVFTFNLKFTKSTKEILLGAKRPTKRELLRLLMSIFDPLGFLTFYLIDMKILLQRLWRSGVGWDETIPEEFAEEWTRWRSVLPEVESVKIPRCYFRKSSSGDSKCELHVFVDASESAYAAVAYLRAGVEGSQEISLVCSKSKVAPLRPISIPRMELSAAVMGARLGNSVVKAHDLNIERIYYWTDSKTVLWWMRSDPRRYKQFVMFRVGEIQEITEIGQWYYVPTKLNVADLATKPTAESTFNPTGRWFTGPEFLKYPADKWPQSQLNVESEGDSELRGRPQTQLVGAHIQAVSKPLAINLERFSRWERLVRSIVYVKRFILKLKRAAVDDDISIEELNWGQHYLYRLAQAQAFSSEIDLLRRNPHCVLAKSSPLRKLSPFLDDTMTLRLRSRLERATCVDDDTRNPIILPKKHYVTKLIVDWYHRKWKHANHETVINEIYQKLYIPGLRTLLRSVRHDCQTCKVHTARPQPPEMGVLPDARLAAFSRPFTHVGVDFFGPFLVTIGRRTEKRYGVVFTCMTCRAVHIEMAYSLTTNSCIMVVRNFIARRGVPRAFYSDNGTNLRATEKELRASLSQVDFGSVKAEFIGSEIDWTFIPPGAPHMGGAWERMVRSIKTVMYQILSPDIKLTDEKLYNLFTEVESIVNSRPLTYLSLDTAEEEALTPNHFLLGSSSGNQPPGNFDKTDQYTRASWRHSQYLAERFWKRWVAEVLPLMTRRTNWFQKQKPIETGDVAVIVDPNSPRYSWPKGVVVTTITGKDGQVRSAVVKTSQGQYHRPATKIAVLDVRRGG